MKVLYHSIKAHKQIYLGLAVYLLFFISASWTHWLDLFFNAGALQYGFQGMDFYQIPRGAWAFWHHGSLTGEPLPNGAFYGPNHFVSSNVYHPLFTFTLGSILMLFQPTTSFYVWMFVKVVVWICAVGYFYWSFHKHKYVQLGVFILLASASNYMELDIAQYQSIFNAILLIFLINLVKQKSHIQSGMLFFLMLMVKPIGLLFVPVLLFKGRSRVALIGVGLYAFCTVAYLLPPFPGWYYVHNLYINILTPIAGIGPTQIITLNALLQYWRMPYSIITALKFSVLSAIVFAGSLRRIHIAKAIFFCVVYFLCFYELLFEYDWSTLAPVIAVCLMCCPAFQTRLSRLFALLTCLPSAYIVFRLLHIDITYGPIHDVYPGIVAWQWIVISKLVPLFLLCGSVLWSDIKPILKQGKAFFLAMRKVNEHLGVFGEEYEEEEPLIVL